MATTRARAGQGDAKVFKAADGRFYAFVELPPGPDGKSAAQEDLCQGARRSDLEARQAVRAQLAKGQSPADDRITVAQAVERWLDSRKKVAPSTIKPTIRHIATGAHRPDRGRPQAHCRPSRPRTSRLSSRLEVRDAWPALREADPHHPRRGRRLRPSSGAKWPGTSSASPRDPSSARRSTVP